MDQPIELPKLSQEEEEKRKFKFLNHHELNYINLLLQDYLNFFNEQPIEKSDEKLRDDYVNSTKLPLAREILEWFDNELEVQELIDYIISTRESLFKTKKLTEYEDELENKLDYLVDTVESMDDEIIVEEELKDEV